jgi:hypothetical protein
VTETPGPFGPELGCHPSNQNNMFAPILAKVAGLIARRQFAIASVIWHQNKPCARVY